MSTKIVDFSKNNFISNNTAKIAFNMKFYRDRHYNKKIIIFNIALFFKI
jgi:hypothetical protein